MGAVAGDGAMGAWPFGWRSTCDCRPTCQSWSTILAPFACTASTTFRQPATCASVVGLQRRLSATNRYVRDQIANGYVGKLRSVRMHVSMNYFQPKLPQALSWTAPPENFSSMMAIYAGHFLDALFVVVGQPAGLTALTVNQFSEITI